LLEDAAESARSDVIAWFSRYRDAATFRGMPKLAVTAPRCIKIPTIVVEHSQHLGDLHCASISSVEPSGKVNLWPNEPR